MNPMQLPQSLTSSDGAFRATVRDPSQAPTQVVTDADAFQVDADWYLESPIIGSLNGQWRLSVAFESLGAGTEGVRPSTTGPISIQPGTADPFNPNRRNYRDQVRFPAGTLPVGAYHLTALLTSTNIPGNAGPFAAYYDLGVIQVMDA